MKIEFYNRRLFWQKMASLFIATGLLVPLVYFKLSLPATLYVGALVVLHIVVFYIYLSKVSWRDLVRNKAAFVTRLLALAFFVYLLVLLKFVGDPMVVLANIFAALVIHCLVICVLMVKHVQVFSGNRK